MSITIYQVLSSPISWLFLVLGLVMGSFFNVCIYRIPRNNFWQSHRSFCPDCGAAIPGWLNIPILSYLFLQGKSRCCRKRIALFYPLVELFTGLLFVFLYWRFPFFAQNAFPTSDIDLPQFIRFAHALVFCSLLLICSVIDLHHKIIPDRISLPMIALSPLVAYVHPELTLRSSLLGVLLGGAGVYLVAWLYYAIRRREGIGMGDAKLLAALGGWLGYQCLIPTVLFASVTGSVIGLLLIVWNRRNTMQTEIPFGPFLSLGAVLYLLSPLHWLELMTLMNGF